MRVLLLIPFLLNVCETFAQLRSSEYHPVFLNACDSTPLIDVKWRLENSEEKVVYSSPWYVEDGRYRVQLTESDNYFVFIEPFMLGSFYDDSLPIRKIQIDIVDQIYFDTIFVQQLELNVCVCSPPSTQFFECGEPADGFKEVRFPEGQLMVQGTFKEGYLQDTLFEYYLDGTLRKWTVYVKGRFRFQEFHPNGIIARDRNPRNGKDITYYSNGQIEQEERWKKRLFSRKTRFRSKSYYEDGTLKDERTKRKNLRYDTQGRLTDKLQRKRDEKLYSFWSNLIHKYDYRYYEYSWTQYDTLGNVISIHEFPEGDSFSNYYPEQLSKVKFFKYFVIYFYEEGNQVLKIQYERSVNDKDWYDVYKMEDNEWIFDRKVDSKELNEIWKKYRVQKQH